ncbi:MAG: outer membrane lipoprotein-sorting protein [Blastocatellia bacterium]
MFRSLCLILLVALTGLTACNSTAPATAPVAETATPAAAPLPDAQPWLSRLATQDGCRDFTADMRLSGEAADGRPVQLEFRVQRKYSPDHTATLLTVTAPPEETEKALLATEKKDQPTEAISYLAGLKKIARFKSDSTRDLRGAKISVQELLGLELSQYAPAQIERVTEGGENLIKVTLQEKPDREMAYPHIEAYFRESSQQPVRFDLFDQQKKLVRVIRVLEVKPVQNYQTLMRIEIEDKSSGHRVRLETVRVKYDQKLPDSIFTEANLTKLISAASRRLIQ